MPNETPETLYLVCQSVSGGFKVHSVHDKRETAHEWRRCKEHDGEDTTLVTMDKDTLAEMVDKFYNAKE